MATARERLLQTLMAIISQPFSEEAKTSLKRLLNSYRVQAKPGENIDKSITARDALAHTIVNHWKTKNYLDKKDITELIEPFRMQLKTGINKKKLSNDTPLEGALLESSFESTQSRRVKIKENINRHENAYFREKSKLPHPDEEKAIAGGPLPKAGGRGQCPKCHSVGIVLARAYGGDDYYSCIYCGYQAYLKSIDPKLDSPLAAGLLGSDFGDQEFDKED